MCQDGNMSRGMSRTMWIGHLGWQHYASSPGDKQIGNNPVVNLDHISECVKMVSCPGECHERCGVDIISVTVDGNIVQAVQVGTQ